jgi:iduronate 2-sulfatase
MCFVREFVMHKMFTLLLGSWFLAGHLGLAVTNKPNVLFIVVDDLKPVLGCYGDKIAKTPNIDKLAARGMLFEKAYVNQAVCAPSRNSLMLGIRPQTMGLYDLKTYFRDIPAYSNAVSMGQTFMKNGYQAESLGKVYHASLDDAPSWSIPRWEAKAETYAKEENRAPDGERKGTTTEAGEVDDNYYQDGKVAEKAIERLRAFQGKPDQPFLLMVGFHKPHLPFVAPKKYWDLYQPAEFPLTEPRTAPEGAPAYAPSTMGEIMQYQKLPGDKLPFPDDFSRHLIHGYYAATSYTDAQIGKVLAALHDMGLDKNTYVVLWGDHGWHLGDHGFWCKHTNYEQATRIPILISGPGIKPGQRSQAVIETVDLYPTLVELTGQTMPETGIPGMGLDGKSLVPVLKDGAQKVKDYVLHAYPRSEKQEEGARRKLIGRAVRNERYRLVEWKEPGTPAEKAAVELYDYETDSLERKNLAQDRPEVVAELRAILGKIPEAKPQVGDEGSPESGYEKKSKKKKKNKGGGE